MTNVEQEVIIGIEMNRGRWSIWNPAATKNSQRSIEVVGGNGEKMKMSRLSRMVSATLMGAGAIALTVTVGATPAMAAPATSQTTHFSTISGWNTSIAPLTNSGCPAWAVNDNVYIDMVGNGVEHFNVNGAGDSWYTTTFAGNGTIGFYAGTAHYDSSGNITSVDGPAEQLRTIDAEQLAGIFVRRDIAAGVRRQDADVRAFEQLTEQRRLREGV